MGKDTDDAVVGFMAWIVTGVLVMVLGIGGGLGVTLVAGPVAGIIAFISITIVIVVFMTKKLNRRYKSNV